ncbi:phosphotriesterase family protein [Pseudonocardia acaciae]|uniref:phosphotriesterase family protein n=1 Tax=Pseudonocardia acaciae TaxID=551276 RepID=UPI0006874C47|nr:hypothetical protein [Pseudonocardia acaciae]
MTGTVRTVLGDVPAGELGMTYVIEHLVSGDPLVKTECSSSHPPDPAAPVAKVGYFAEAGVAALVHPVPSASGRDIIRLVEASRRTGVHLVAATGLRRSRDNRATHWLGRLEPVELARLFTADVLRGIDAFDYTGPAVRSTGHRAGFITIATGDETLTARDRPIIAAVGLAHRATGAPVLAHCEGGRGASEWLEALTEAGVPAESVLLGHMDKVADPGYHRELAASGATLEYDQALLHADNPDNQTVRLVTALLADGLAHRIVLGVDCSHRAPWGTSRPKGLAWLATGLRDQLIAAGVDAGTLHMLYVENPARALTLAPGNPGILADQAP